VLRLLVAWDSQLLLNFYWDIIGLAG